MTPGLIGAEGDPSTLYVSLVSGVVGALIGVTGAVAGGILTTRHAHNLVVREEHRRAQLAALEEMRLGIVEPIKRMLDWETTTGKVQVGRLWPPIIDGMIKFKEDWDLRWNFIVVDRQLRLALKTLIEELFAVDRAVNRVRAAKTPEEGQRIVDEEFGPSWEQLAKTLNAAHWHIQAAAVALIRGRLAKRRFALRRKKQPPRQIPDLERLVDEIRDARTEYEVNGDADEAR